MSQARQWFNPWASDRRVMSMAMLSLLCHVVALVFIAVGPGLFASRETLSPIYTVDLVGDLTLPPPPAAAPAEKPEAAKVESQPQPVAKVETPPPAELIPVGKDKTAAKVETLEKLGTPKESSKVKEVKAEDEIKNALNRIEKKVSSAKEEAKEPPKTSGEDLEAKHLAQALIRTKQRVEAGAYGLGVGSASGDDKFALYYTQVWQKVRSNWTLPPEWRSPNVEAIIIITVRPDGLILESRFEKHSGLPLFDQSAARAVELSNPLPPLPQGLTGKSLEIGLVFRPEA